MIKNGIELVNGWTLYFDEVSNNIYQVELIDKLGRKTSSKDNDLESAIETCLGFALDIEHQLGNAINKFTYDTFNYYLGNLKLTSNYSDLDFGSWLISSSNQRILLDGKESLLFLQHKTELNGWKDTSSVNIRKLSFADIKAMVDRFYILYAR